MDLNAFFGVLLDVDPWTTNYRADGAGIKVLPEGGYNCYLPNRRRAWTVKFQVGPTPVCCVCRAVLMKRLDGMHNSDFNAYL